MPASDPNRNAGWDWTASGAGHTIYYTALNGAVQSKVVQLPFYTGGHPLNTLEKDMYPQDGWVLAYRDFGTPGSAPDVPFFALYNKYRGVFRIMLYNTRELVYTRFELDLSFKSTAATGALLTYSEDKRAFRDDYDPAKKETYLVEANSINGWIYADYMFSGYDPTMHSGTQMRLQIRGIDVSQVQLESTTFTLTEIMSEANPGGSLSVGSVLDAANSASKWFSGTEKAAKTLRDNAANPEHRFKWWKHIVQSIVGTAANPTNVVSIAPFIGGLMGVVKSFFGGMDDPAPRQPLRFEGVLKMSGSITQSAPLYALDFALTHVAGDNPPDHYLPVQPISWGIFNLNTRPPVNFDYYGYYCETASDCYWPYRVSFPAAPSYVLNPNAGLQLVSVEYAFTTSTNPTPFGQWNSILLDDICGCGYIVTGFAVKLTLKTLAPTLYFDDDLVFYKQYTFPWYNGFANVPPRGAELPILSDKVQIDGN